MLGLLLLVAVWTGIGWLGERLVSSAPVPLRHIPPSYELIPGPNDSKSWQIAFHNAPRFVHALAMAPRQREATIEAGRWLVLNFFVMSVPDYKNIEVAMRAVGHFGRRVQLGVRPVASHEEVVQWFPEHQHNRGSPVWIVLDNGIAKGWQAGQMNENQILTLLAKHVRD
jgi:hypothetical protein